MRNEWPIEKTEDMSYKVYTRLSYIADHGMRLRSSSASWPSLLPVSQKPTTKFYNKFMHSGIFPDILKTGMVSPVHKKR